MQGFLILVATLSSFALAATTAAQPRFTAEMICDVVEGTSSSNPQDFTKAGGTLYFTADNGVDGREVFRMTSGGCQSINFPLSNYAPTELTAVNGDLYFATNTDAEGQEVGGVVGGVPMFLPIRAGTSDGLERPDLVAFQGSVYFSGTDGGSDGTELWKITDGVAAQAVDIADPGGSFPHQLFAAPDRLYFEATTQATGTDVFAFTGSSLISFDVAAGTSNSEFFAPTVRGDILYFSSTPPGPLCPCIYVVPPGNTTALLVEAYAEIDLIGIVADRLFIVADDGVNGTELHIQDDPMDTPVLQELVAGPFDSDVKEVTPIGDLLYLNANDGVIGQETNVFDPATGQFIASFDTNPGPDGSDPYGYAFLSDDSAVFGAFIAGLGDEVVYAFSQLKGSTTLDFNSGSQSSSPDMFTSIEIDADDNAVFARANTSGGREVVYVSQNGAKIDANIVQLDGGPADPTNLTAVDGDLYFSGSTTAEGREPRFIQVAPEPASGVLQFAAIFALAGLARRSPQGSIRNQVPKLRENT